MKTKIILIGMISLGFLNANHAATAKQERFNYQSENEQFLELVSSNTEVNTIGNSTEKNYYYFDPSSVIPISEKTLEQEIKEDNLIVESTINTEISLATLTVKSIYKIIDEDLQITEAAGLNVYQPLDFEAIDNDPNNAIEFQNKCSLKQENIKL
jgi:putative NADH-flavin reductase